MQKIKVLFVCMGNICRSPTAHGVFRRYVQESGLHNHIEIDSAGTHAYHVGEPPDKRAQQAAQKRGVNLSDLRARQVNATDFVHYDYILAMDNDNYAILEALCPPEEMHKLYLFLTFAPDMDVREVPDPYYGGDSGFERVLNLVEAASLGLLAEIKRDTGWT